MRLQPIFAAVVVALTFALCTTSSSQAEVLTFDDISTEIGAAVPNFYGNLFWSNMNYLDTTFTLIAVPNSGYANGVVSPNYVAYNANGNDASILTLDEPFNFAGAYFAAAWNDGLNITITANHPSGPADAQTIVVNTSGSSYFPLNFTNVAQLSFHSFGGTRAPNTGDGPGGTHFVMDNFTIAGVPEPASLSLMGMAGLSMLSIARRRRLKLAA